jgi:hypothetical protein
MAISSIFLEIWRLFANCPKIPFVGFPQKNFCSQLMKFCGKKGKTIHGKTIMLCTITSKYTRNFGIGLHQT